MTKSEESEKVRWAEVPQSETLANGVFIGTSEGSIKERRELAQVFRDVYDALGRNLGKPARYAEIELRLRIQDGKLSICECVEKKSYKP